MSGISTGTPPGGSAAAGGVKGLYDNVVAPIPPALMAPSVAVSTANLARLVRVVIPKTGILHDIAAYIDVASGNLDVGVYSTAGTRAKLYSSGSVVCPAAPGWKIVADPALAVTAGDVLDLALAVDNAVASFGFWTLTTPQSTQLPTNFLPGNGALEKMIGQAATSFPLPATLAEATVTQPNPSRGLALIARVA